MGVVECFKEKFVSEYVDSKLFIFEGVNVGGSVVGCCVYFEGDGVEGFFYVY